MLRVLHSLWIWLASGTLIVCWAGVVASIRAFDHAPFLRTARSFRRLGILLGKVNPWRIHIAGREHIDPGGVYVVVSNHQSLADIPLIAHLKLDAKWLAKAELFRVPFVGWMLMMSGDIPVHRMNRRKGAQAFLQAARTLRQGCSTVFFPEGTRSHDGSVLPFNDGPFQLAVREGVPVLPVVVDGTRTALPRSSWLFGRTQNLYLRVLPPVLPNVAPDAATLRETIREMIAGELHGLRAGAGTGG